MRRPGRSAAGESWQHWYSGARWRKIRRIHLSAEPICRMCADEGRITPATVVDHIEAHKGSEAKFYDPNNLQALCKPCHDRHAQRRDRTGKVTPVIGIDGWPTH